MKIITHSSRNLLHFDFGYGDFVILAALPPNLKLVHNTAAFLAAEQLKKLLQDKSNPEQQNSLTRK